MANETLAGLYEVVQQRQANPQEGSYTCYLFEKGLDKILKKCGEECSEMIIAAKNMDNEELKNEISDLVYHVMVLMVQQGLPLEEVEAVLEQRRQKIGNLKQFHVSDHNT
jgi:phosphoribosyl-ATP pyrophosphohydrolase